MTGLPTPQPWQLFAHSKNSEWFSIIFVFIFEFNIAAEHVWVQHCCWTYLSSTLLLNMFEFNIAAEHVWVQHCCWTETSL